MNGHHSSKTISFLMELIFVLFFFTIASAISVFVIVNAKDKNEQAMNYRNALLYGKNLIANYEDQGVASYLEKDSFYLDDKGTPSEEKQDYKVRIKRGDVKGLDDKEQCTMYVVKDTTEVALSFLLDKGGQE